MFTWILLLLIFVDHSVTYSRMSACPIANAVLLLPVLLVASGICFLLNRTTATRRSSAPPRVFLLQLAGVCLLLFFLQCLVVSLICFRTGWDVNVIMRATDQIAFTDTKASSYFTRYPNNIMLSAVFVVLKRLLAMLGINTYLSLCMFGTAAVSLSGFLTACTVYRITEQKVYALSALILFMLLFGFSPWITIPYSDVFAMPFTAAICLLYTTRCAKHRCCRWAGIGLCAFIGMQIKPTVIIVLIAILILSTFHSLRGQNRNQLLQKGAILLIMTATFFASQAILSVAEYGIRYQADDNTKLSLTHFAMMGLNKETTGTYSAADVKASASCKTAEERTSLNLTVIRERLKNFGFIGYLKFLGKKTLVVMNDGTFAWSKEGTFYLETYPADGAFSNALRSYWYADGAHYPVFAGISQSLWLLCLLLMTGCVFSSSGKSGSFLLLTFIGVFLFLLIFEARARYLYCFAPVITLTATLGLRQYCQIFNKNRIIKFKRKCKS